MYIPRTLCLAGSADTPAPHARGRGLELLRQIRRHSRPGRTSPANHAPVPEIPTSSLDILQWWLPIKNKLVKNKLAKNKLGCTPRLERTFIPGMVILSKAATLLYDAAIFSTQATAQSKAPS